MTKRLALFALAFLIILTIFPSAALATERYEILKLGDDDSYVLALQQKLKELGYFTVRATGYFGTVTQQSVIEYQTDHDLAVDGKAGPQTLAAIMGSGFSIPADRFVSDDDSFDKFYPGDRGDEVKRIRSGSKSSNITIIPALPDTTVRSPNKPSHVFNAPTISLMTVSPAQTPCRCSIRKTPNISVSIPEIAAMTSI